MKQCTGAHAGSRTFLYSRCNPNPNLRALLVYCERGPYVEIFRQSCAVNELCVDTGITLADALAYCASSNNFFRVPDSTSRRVTGDFELHISSINIPSAAVAILVDDSRSCGMTGVDVFEFSALRETVPIGQGVVPRTVVLDSVRCSDCYNLALQPLSTEVSFLRARVDVRGAGSGLLYIITIL